MSDKTVVDVILNHWCDCGTCDDCIGMGWVDSSGMLPRIEQALAEKVWGPDKLAEAIEIVKFRNEGGGA